MNKTPRTAKGAFYPEDLRANPNIDHFTSETLVRVRYGLALAQEVIDQIDLSNLMPDAVIGLFNHLEAMKGAVNFEAERTSKGGEK